MPAQLLMTHSMSSSRVGLVQMLPSCGGGQKVGFLTIFEFFLHLDLRCPPGHVKLTDRSLEFRIDEDVHNLDDARAATGHVTDIDVFIFQPLQDSLVPEEWNDQKDKISTVLDTCGRTFESVWGPS